MKLGIAFANAGPSAEPAHAAALAAAAEEAGVESLWTVEHVVVPAGYASEYPYNRSGRMAGEMSAIPDPLVWLAWVAARTTTILLCTGILILPQRNPLITAKEVATLDRLSGGRVRLGVGIGWLREEFEVLGVPFAGRGHRTDEWVRAMRILWGEEEPSFEGELVRFERARMFPKPEHGGVPVIVGGHTESSARRAGRLGDGYFPGKGSPEELAHLIAVMRRAAEDEGRDPDGIELTAGGRPTRETAERYRELGISRLTIAPPAYDVERLREGLAAAVAAVGDV